MEMPVAESVPPLPAVSMLRNHVPELSYNSTYVSRPLAGATLKSSVVVPFGAVMLK